MQEMKVWAKNNYRKLRDIPADPKHINWVFINIYDNEATMEKNKGLVRDFKKYMTALKEQLKKHSTKIWNII